jgi:hypothetical protein
MDESPSSADLELLQREIQVLEEENFVLTDAKETIEASISSPKAHSEQGDLNAPSGHKVRYGRSKFRTPLIMRAPSLKKSCISVAADNDHCV